MRFLLDVCVDSRALRSSLIELGHDVLSASENFAQAPDEEILELAYKQDRILITEDKDFWQTGFRAR